MGAFFYLPTPRIAPPVQRAIVTVQGWQPFCRWSHARSLTGFDDLVDSALGVSLKSLVQNRPRGWPHAGITGSALGPKKGLAGLGANAPCSRARPCTLPTRTRERHNSSSPKLTAKLHSQFPFSSPANSTTARLLRTPALSLAASLSP